MHTASMTLASGGAAPPAKKAKAAGGHGGGHGAEKKSGHGAEKKKAEGGHGAAKKSGHGEAKGGHGAEKKGGHGSSDAKKGAHGSSHGAAGEAHAPPPPDPTYAPELSELLHLIETKHAKLSQAKLSELDLGEFKLTHAGPGEGRMATVTFHLYALVPDDKLTEVTDAIPAHEKRIRDLILSTVHEAPYEDLNEPNMPTVKARITTGVNRILSSVEVRDVVFSTLSTRLMH
jgi:hypothetical protein